MNLFLPLLLLLPGYSGWILAAASKFFSIFEFFTSGIGVWTRFFYPLQEQNLVYCKLLRTFSSVHSRLGCLVSYLHLLRLLRVRVQVVEGGTSHTFCYFLITLLAFSLELISVHTHALVSSVFFFYPISLLLDFIKSSYIFLVWTTFTTLCK